MANPNYGLPTINDLAARAAKSGGSASSRSGFATLQNEPILPDWMATDPNKLVGELMSEYKGAGKMFDVAGLGRSFDRSIDTAMGMGGQIAENAGREAISRAGMEGGSANSAMVKAQSMLPVYEHTAGLRKDKALAVADMRARQASLTTTIASTLGQLRTSYLSALGDSYLRGRGQLMGWEESQRNFDSQEEARQAALSAMGGGGGGRGGGGGDYTDFSPGYITNSGPLFDARVNGVTRPATVFGSWNSNWL